MNEPLYGDHVRIDDGGVRAKKRRFKYLFSRVRQILMRAWDPVGVSNRRRKEYDDYAMRICSRLLDAASTESEVAAYLAYVEAEWMGLTPVDRRAIDRTVSALLALKRELAES